MRFRVIEDPNVLKFFEEYPQYRTARVYQYTPAEFMSAFGELVGYVDLWDWAYGPEVYKELFYVKEVGQYKVLPHFAKSGSASSGESAVELVGNIDVLKNLLKDYEGIVIYIYYREERGGERTQKEVIYTYLP